MVIPKGNRVTKRDGKASTSRMRLSVGPNGKLGREVRKLEEYDGSPGYLTRGKRAEGKANCREQEQEVTFFLALKYFQMSYFSKVSKEDPYQFPTSIWDLKPTGNKDPSHDLFSSSLN